MTLLKGMSGVSSPYLKPDRLAQVLAAIQVMAVSDQYRRHVTDWTYYLSGIKATKSQSQSSEPDSDPDPSTPTPTSSSASGPDAEDDAAKQWSIVFDEHPEFFRQSPGKPGYYALVLRRGLPRRFHLDKRDLISPTDLAQMPPEQRKKKITRAPIPPPEIKVLLDAALSLYREATERKAAKRAIWLALFPVVSALISGLLGWAPGRHI